ncbi:MAG: hypothetical protein U0521_09605 [Anaerolineae bacterium]
MRQPADNRHALPGKLAGEERRRVASVRRGFARPDYRQRQPILLGDLAPTVQRQRRVGQVLEQGGVIGVLRRQQACVRPPDPVHLGVKVEPRPRCQQICRRLRVETGFAQPTLARPHAACSVPNARASTSSRLGPMPGTRLKPSQYLRSSTAMTGRCTDTQTSI